MAERQQSFTAAIGQEAEEADTHKARWKHVEKKAAQKLLGRYGHQLLLAAVGVIFPAERHLTIGEVYKPVIGDGDAMGVTGQVGKDVLRATERRFSVHDPILAEERAKKRAEGRFVLNQAEGCREKPTVFFEKLTSIQP
jgi:hypothetical protein